MAITLTVVMVDTQRTRIAIIHENEHMPYRRRSVSVQLTPEQLKQLEPREVGYERGGPVFEEYGPSWLEVS